MKKSAGPETQVFISASKEDYPWRDRLKAKLDSRKVRVGWWDDSKIETGSDWQAEIDSAIRRASVAVILLSPTYLKSKTATDELTRLMQRNEEEKALRLFPIVVHKCGWQKLQIGKTQIWANGKPLAELSDEAVETELEEIAERIVEIVRNRRANKPRERAQASSATGEAKAQFQFSKTAEGVLKRAVALAKQSHRAGVTSSCILFAFAEAAESQPDTSRFVRDGLNRAGKYDEAFARFLEDSGSAAGQTAVNVGGILGPVSKNIRAILESAATFAHRVTGRSSQIHQRHLLAALLVGPQTGAVPIARKRLEEMGVSLPAFCSEFREFIRGHTTGESEAEWDSILLTNAPKEGTVASPDNEFISGPAGFTSEFCGVGGSEPVFDQLGVEDLAHRLADLIALRETKLPLAIGLFGNWGSGKSHFMNLMDRRMKALAAETSQEWARRSEESGLGAEPKVSPNGPWCRQIVPIYFNAWHYLDTNLWASLVTEIFDGLFRHIAGDADSEENRKEKVKKLLRELQKANGAAAGAEESLELAKAAKAQAEKEEHEAEVEAQRAARRRDQIEGLVAGVLDNLEKLVPEGEMLEGWREAVRVLHLEEARKSCSALAAQVAEFKSLQGRARAIGRAVLAPDGRTRRVAWLVGAVLGAPLVVGLAAWGLTAWSVEIRQVGMVMGEVTGLLAGVGAWCGVQVQRGRKLLGQVEELEKTARKKQSLKEETPKLKRARAKLAKLIEKEEVARTKVKEARAKVRRLEEELRELRPERRLFRFIEQRAQAQDYRAHLGLVSLVRRDFHELSRLFAETVADAQSEATRLDEERVERQKLGASIDRIVLFVDDLDRCQPEKVVDVLQAVHLLLAYPLFAVVVGVDQRCLKQSIEKQFVGLVSQGNGAHDEERPATSLDYLEKIFHVPFHLPPMGEKGFAALIHNLTEPPFIPEAQDSEPAMSDEPQGEQTNTTDGLDRTEVTDIATTDEQKEKAGQTSAANASRPRVIGSVPLFPWERTALKDYHPLIRTPRAATRLLNTYRLVRAGIPAEEWEPFRGDEKMHGEFRVVMFLLASSAGYPAVARNWFATLRNADSTALAMDDPDHVGDQDWARFHQVYSAIFEQTSPQPTKELFAKWLDRVERFAF